MTAADGTFLLSSAAVFLAALAHGATGFGSALVAMPLLSLVMDIRAVTPLVALLTLTVNLLFLLSFRRDLVPGRILFLGAGAAAGLAPGVFLLRRGGGPLLENLLGALLVLYGATSLLARPAAVAVGRRGAFLLGLASGCLGGALNTGGPPAVIYAVSQPWTKEEIHVTLQFYFFLVGLAVACAHLISGLTTSATLDLYARLLPALLAGAAAGGLLHRRIDRERYRRLLLFMLTALGALILGR